MDNAPAFVENGVTDSPFWDLPSVIVPDVLHPVGVAYVFHDIEVETWSEQRSDWKLQRG